MLRKTTCNSDFSALRGFSCIPDGGLEWIDIFHFRATSTDSTGDLFEAHVCVPMIFKHKSGTTSALLEGFLVSGIILHEISEMISTSRQQVKI